ncbi:MAG: PEP-CTERM sorting domain-containing protein [Proteobacteria bacterium]|nr:PEP-CTERM sorting domain-containing protein [Pseudomonadota bacterium]
MAIIKVLSVCVCLLVALAPKTVLSVPVYGSTYALDGFTNVIIGGETWDVSFSDILVYDPSIHGNVIDAAAFALEANYKLGNNFITYKTDIEAALLSSPTLLMPGCDVGTVGSPYIVCEVMTVDDLYTVDGLLPPIGVIGPVLDVSVISGVLSSADGGTESYDARDGLTFANWTRVEATVPEPSVAILLTSGLIAFGVVRRKTRG